MLSDIHWIISVLRHTYSEKRQFVLITGGRTSNIAASVLAKGVNVSVSIYVARIFFLSTVLNHESI